MTTTMFERQTLLHVNGCSGTHVMHHPYKYIKKQQFLTYPTAQLDFKDSTQMLRTLLSRGEETGARVSYMHV